MPLTPKGRLAENVVHFVRVLRAAGLPVGPARALAALEAVEAVGLANRDDFRAALAAVLVSRYEHLPIFEQAFDLFWRNPRLLEKLIAALLPTVFGRGGEQDAPPELPARIAQAMLPPAALEPQSAGRRRDRARRGVHDVAARGAAAQGFRDDDRGGACRGAGDADEVQTAAARTADAPHRAVGSRPPDRPSRHAAPGDRRVRHAVPARMAQAATAHAAARRAVRHLGLDGPLRAHAAALPPRDHERQGPRARAPVRHAAHQRHAPLEASRHRRRVVARHVRRVRLGGRHADRQLPRGLQPALVAASPRPECRRAADQRRPRVRCRRGSRAADGAAREVLPAARLAQPAAALRRLRSAPGRHPGDAAARRRLPAGAQPREPHRPRGGARPAAASGPRCTCSLQPTAGCIEDPPWK